MNAAEALFIQKGLGPTTIEEIALGAGVAKGTFYLHFTSKEQVHDALAQRFYSRHIGRADAAVAAAADDWQARLAAWIGAAVTNLKTDGPLIEMLFHSTPMTPQCVINPIVDHLQDLVEAGARAGAWTVVDARRTAQFLWGGLHTLLDAALLDDGTDLADLSRTIQRLFVGTLRA